jgi:hypothetical protein
VVGTKKRVAIRKNVDKDPLGPCNGRQEGGCNDHDNGRVICRSLELMTALGMMEDHNRLLPATGSTSGSVSDATRNRGVLVLCCVLLALGSLLCAGKESQAAPPGKAPEPGGNAAAHRPTSQRPPSSGPADGAPVADRGNPGAPAAQPKPEPVERGPASRPAHPRPAEQRPIRQQPTEQRSTERPAPGPKHPAEPPGRQFAPHERPAHAQKPVSEPRSVPEKPVREPKPVHEKPVHEPRSVPEPPGPREPGREQGPQGPVGVDRTGFRPQQEQADGGPSSRPVHERPTLPQTKPPDPHDSASAVQQEDVGSPDQYGKPAGIPAGTPDRQKVYSEGKRSAGPPEQAPQPPRSGAAGRFGPEKMPVDSAHYSRTRPEEGTLYKRPVHVGTSASTPDGRHASIGSMGAEEPAEHRTQATALAGHETGSDIASGAQPTRREISRPLSADFRGEEPARLAGSPPASRAVESSPAVEPARGRDAGIPAAPPGGKRGATGEQAQSAPGTPFGSTKFLADPLMDKRGSLVDLSKEALRSVPGGTHDPSKGALYRGSLTQRGPPLEIPSPFLGFVPMLGGVASGVGSSGSGTAPLLAVLAPCLIALLYRSRSRILCSFLRPVTVPRPALERPG